MTRKQRVQNNETWDLSSTRGAQALRAAILAEEDGGGEGSALSSRGKGPGGRRARAAAHASDRRVPFQLREDVTDAAGAPSSQSRGGAGTAPTSTRGADADANNAETWLARQLDPSAEPALIRDVLFGCGGDARAALEALRAMLGVDEGEEQEEEEGPPPGAAAAPTADDPAADDPPHYWGALHPSLPSELQDIVLQQLPVRDLARVACSGRALRLAARREMRRAKTVPAPPGVSPAELRGMTTALSGAATADLSRALVDEVAIPEGALHAQMAREQQVGLLLRALSQGAALRLATAAAGGSSSGPGATVVPLSRLVFARGAAEGLTDYALRSGVLGIAASEEEPPLPHVREIAAARAPLTSAGLRALARHRARAAAAEPPLSPSEATTTTGFESIALVECSGVRDDGVRALLATHPCRNSLRRLDLTGCPALTSAAFRGLHAPGVALRSLKAANLHSLTGNLALLLPHDHPLEELDFSGCPRLESLFVNAPRLRELKLRGCRRLASLAGKFPSLEQLLAADAPALAFFAGGQVATPTDPIPPLFAPRLRVVDLKGCAAVADAAARAVILSDGQGRAPALQALSLAGTAVASLELSEELAPCLKRLDVGGCRSLQRLSVGGGSLRELLAGGCRALRALTLLAPAKRGLRRLQLSNCAALSAVAVGRRPDADHQGDDGVDDGAAGGVNLDGTPLLSAADEAALRALVVVVAVGR